MFHKLCFGKFNGFNSFLGCHPGGWYAPTLVILSKPPLPARRTIIRPAAKGNFKPVWERGKTAILAVVDSGHLGCSLGRGSRSCTAPHRSEETGWKPVFHHRQDACFPSQAGSLPSGPPWPVGPRRLKSRRPAYCASTRTNNLPPVGGAVSVSVTDTVCTSATSESGVWLAVASSVQVFRSSEVNTL